MEVDGSLAAFIKPVLGSHLSEMNPVDIVTIPAFLRFVYLKILHAFLIFSMRGTFLPGLTFLSFVSFLPLFLSFLAQALCLNIRSITSSPLARVLNEEHCGVEKYL